MRLTRCPRAAPSRWRRRVVPAPRRSSSGATPCRSRCATPARASPTTSWRRASSRCSRRSPGRARAVGSGSRRGSGRVTVARCACEAVSAAGPRSRSRCRWGGQAMRQQPKVLVVDDEESVVVTIKAILQLDGYDVATTTSAAEARKMVRDQEFDLVLTDLRLEDGDGLEVLRAVREHFPETVTIMLTGYASLESAIQALRVGAYDYLVKPSEVEELRSTVARGIERRRLGLELKARVVELERANRAVADLNSSLQLRIDEATAELKERYEQLKELDRMQSQFLSIASHELKTPITAMSAFLQVSLRRVRRASYGAASAPVAEGLRGITEQLEVVYRQTTKLARVVDELLDVSRIQTGRIEFRYGDVDIGELANEVATRMQLTTTTHSISVTRDSASGVTKGSRLNVTIPRVPVGATKPDVAQPSAARR